MVLQRVLGIDPGFRYIGWTLCYDVTKTNMIPIASGLIETYKDKTEADQLHDRVIRFNHILEQLAPYAKGVDWIVMEDTYSMSKVALVMGGIMRLAQENNVPVMFISPAKVKTALLGKQARIPRGQPKPDTKKLVGDYMLNRYPVLNNLLEKVPNKLKEHPIDSCAVIQAAVNLDTVLSRSLKGIS